MRKDDFRSGLPSANGSPFRTKNFNKFFFGIMLAAIILVALFFAFFYHARKAHPPATVSPAGASSLNQPKGSRVDLLNGADAASVELS